MKDMKKRSIRVMELDDFMCRCGECDFEVTCEGKRPVRICCRRCTRSYAVKKLESRTRISNCRWDIFYPLFFFCHPFFFNNSHPLAVISHNPEAFTSI